MIRFHTFLQVATILALLLMSSCSQSVKHDGLLFNISGSEATVSAPLSHSVSSVTIPDIIVCNGDTIAVTAIGNNAFKGCKRLTSVTIPQSITEIKPGAFGGCSQLKQIFCRIAAPLAIDSTTFQGVDRNRCQIFVPMMCEPSYENADEWRQFAIATDASVVDFL